MSLVSFVFTRKLVAWSLCLLFLAQWPLAHASPVLDRKTIKEVKQSNGAWLYSQKPSGQLFQGQMKIKRGGTTSTCLYKAGLRDGKCVFHKKNGLLSKVIVFANGLRKSETRYHQDGKQIRETTNYNPNTRKKNGAYVSYDKKGVMRMKGAYAASKRTGQWVLRNAKNVVSQQVGFKDGKKHGVNKQYNDKGQLQYETHYANNKPHGKYAYYSGKGAGGQMLLSEQGSYLHGNKHQTWTRYRRDSKVISSKNRYHAGVLLETHNFRDNGALFEHVRRDKDGKDILSEVFHPNGNLEERRTYTYSDGMRHLKSETWNKDGSKK